MPKYWRPLTQDELPYLAGGDTLTLRLNYLYNPERLPVTYVPALCVERRKRDGTFLIEGTDTPISISLTEVGRYVDTGWHMTGEERSKLKSGDLVILVADDRTSIKMKKQIYRLLCKKREELDEEISVFALALAETEEEETSEG
jgi:hypothetical protein